jgi:hypothetical protein
VEAEIGGTTAGSEYDQLNIAGTAELGGALSVVLLGGWHPMPGDVFEIIACGSRSGEFASAAGLDDLGGHAGLDFDLNYEPDGVELEAVAVKGDSDLDADVDIFDLGRLANNYGQSGRTWLHGDYDGDGDVDIFDLGHLANHYGWHEGGGSAGLTTGGEPIPEPASTVLIGLGLPAHLRRRRRAWGP